MPAERRCRKRDEHALAIKIEIGEIGKGRYCDLPTGRYYFFRSLMDGGYGQISGGGANAEVVV